MKVKQRKRRPRKIRQRIKYLRKALFLKPNVRYCVFNYEPCNGNKCSDGNGKDCPYLFYGTELVKSRKFPKICLSGKVVLKKKRRR